MRRLRRRRLARWWGCRRRSICCSMSSNGASRSGRDTQIGVSSIVDELVRWLRCICLVFSIHRFGVSSRLWRYTAQADGMVPEVSDVTGLVDVVSCLLFHCAYVIGSRQVQKVYIHHLGGCSEATSIRLTWHLKSIQRSNTYVPFVGILPMFTTYTSMVNHFLALNIEALIHCGRKCEDENIKKST